ncbi:MAG TPA: DUF3300 domain-containing protein [Luteibacter sp.]|nr:DUF3300 domain-containing protein [Luteibacter sp.]
MAPCITWRTIRLLGAALLLLAGVAMAQDAPQKTFRTEQIDQFVAPVALYPDALLSQIFMASTYPSDVAEAAAWSKANPKATGDAAVKQVSGKPWDPSVQSLVAFPQVLAQMAAHPDWVQNIGDAFLAQPDDVMASVQRLRAQAQKAGNLKTTEQQKVVVKETAPQTTVIQIEPANPEVVYVPSYNPTVVYGTWAYPSYPPTYWPPPPGYYHPVATGLAAGLAFGTGIAIADSLWGGFDWGHNDVDINVNRYNNINVNNRISGNGNVAWNHNPANRRGTPYRDPATRQRFDQGVGGAQQRQAFRGHDTTRDASRERAMQSFDRQTHGGAAASARRPGEGGLAGGNRADRPGAAGAGTRNPAVADRANRAGGSERMNRPGGDGGALQRSSGGTRANAFSGVRSPGNTSAQRQRGESSMRSFGGQHGGGAAARPVNRPAPSRGGGFHRR